MECKGEMLCSSVVGRSDSTFGYSKQQTIGRFIIVEGGGGGVNCQHQEKTLSSSSSSSYHFASESYYLHSDREHAM
jgi:hypothetical protein